MYTKYWRLKERPFEDGPDLRFGYAAAQGQEGLARLLYSARQRKPGALLLGEAGVGKSFIKMQFINKLATVGNFAVAVVDNPLLDIGEMYTDIALQISGKPPTNVNRGGQLRELREIFLQRHQSGYHNLVLIDDAHLIRDRGVLEQLRLLLELYDNQGMHLSTMIFMGQPLFGELLRDSDSLDQQIVSRWVLTPFSAEQTRDYITYRLSVAGGNGWIIDDDAVDEIQLQTGGVAREINITCDLALYLGMSENAVRVDRGIVERIVRDRREALLASDGG